MLSFLSSVICSYHFLLSHFIFPSLLIHLILFFIPSFTCFTYSSICSVFLVHLNFLLLTHSFIVILFHLTVHSNFLIHSFIQYFSFSFVLSLLLTLTHSFLLLSFFLLLFTLLLFITFIQLFSHSFLQTINIF